MWARLIFRAPAFPARVISSSPSFSGLLNSITYFLAIIPSFQAGGLWPILRVKIFLLKYYIVLLLASFSYCRSLVWHFFSPAQSIRNPFFDGKIPSVEFFRKAFRSPNLVPSIKFYLGAGFVVMLIGTGNFERVLDVLVALTLTSIFCPAFFGFFSAYQIYMAMLRIRHRNRYGKRHGS